MEVLLLKNDGRCRWLEKKVLNGVFQQVIKSTMDPSAKKVYVITDWISNDSGRVGVDLKWLKGLGIPAVRSYKELPDGNDYFVLNTGYDSIVHEEKSLSDKGIKIIDLPCPYIRNIRKIFEEYDSKYQYVLLCEPNHIIIKNYVSLYPKDLILVQMNNFEERIIREEIGKPFRLVPYVTFLPSHVETVFDFINKNYPDRCNDKIDTCCMWVKSPSSPITEIDKLDNNDLKGIDKALLITTHGSTNKSLVSMIETITSKGLNVETISSLREFRRYKRMHNNSKVLLVRSPIPNKAERPILAYIEHGYFRAMLILLIESNFYQQFVLGVYRKTIFYTKLFIGKVWMLKKEKNHETNHNT